MRFASIADQRTKSEQELIVFVHEKERVLLPTPPTFAEAQRLARDTFNLDVEQDVVFETTDLAGCSDLGPVQIREASWAGIFPVLPKIFVRTVQRREATGNQDTRRLTQNVSTKSSRASRLFDDAPPRANNDTSDLRKSLASVFQNALKEDGASDARTSRVSASASRNSILSKRASQSSAFMNPLQNGAPQHNEMDEEEEAFFGIPSPSKGVRPQRKQVLSDSEDEQEGNYDRANVNEAQSAEDEDDEAAVEQEVSRRSISHRSSSGSTLSDLKGKSKSLGKDQRQSISVIKESSDSQMARGSVRPPIKTPDLQTLLKPLENPETTFLITVDYDDGDPEGPRTSTFKTKGRHTVHKVLHTVCKTFGLEDYYQQARMILVVEEAIGTDKVIEHKYLCVNNDTMAHAGARPDSRFELVIEDEEE